MDKLITVVIIYLLIPAISSKLFGNKKNNDLKKDNQVSNNKKLFNSSQERNLFKKLDDYSNRLFKKENEKNLTSKDKAKVVREKVDNSFSLNEDINKKRESVISDIKKERESVKDSLISIKENKSFFDEIEDEKEYKEFNVDFSNESLVNSIIMKEILDKPVSLRK
ncbi:MAG: hypothetical protein ACTJGH_06245 [Peptoniphilaceae bacterium]